MSDLVKALGADGPGHTLVVAGRELRFSSITVAMKAEYESWIEATLADTTRRTLAPLGDPAVTAEAMLRLSEKINSGHYRWGDGEGWADQVRGVRGMLKLLELVLRQHQPKITPEEVRALLIADAAESKELAVTTPDGKPTTRLGLMLKGLIEEGK